MANDLAPTLQSAPTLQGLVSDATNLVGTTVVTPLGSRRYRGEVQGTLTFACTQAGTVGTSESRWSISGLASSAITLIIPASYTVNDPIHIYEGFGLAFGSDSHSVNDVFQVTLTPRRSVAIGHREVTTSGKVEVAPESLGYQDGDASVETWDRRLKKQRRAIMRPLPVSVTVSDKAASRNLDDMGAERLDVTFMENYDFSTLILFRGQEAAGVPVIGRYKTATGLAGTPRQDPVSGLISATPTATNLFATVPGPEIECRDASWPTRMQIPPPYNDIGTGIIISSAGQTNELAHSHPENGALRWSAGGTGSSVAWDPNVFGVYDPTDSSIPEKFKQGTMYTVLGSSSATIVTAAADRWTVAEGNYVAAQVWIKGRGKIRIEIRTGVTTPGTVLHETNVDLADGEGRWIGVHTDGGSGDTVPAFHTVAEIRIRTQSGENRAEFWVSHASAQKRVVASLGHITDGASGNTAGYQLKFDDTPMPTEGTMSMVFMWGGDVGTGIYHMIGSTTGPNNFQVVYNAGTNTLRVSFDNGANYTDASATFEAHCWYQLIIRWGTSATTDELAVTIAIDETIVTETSIASSAHLGTYGDIIISPTTVEGGTGNCVNFGLWEFRLDGRARTNAQIQRDYRRWTHDAHTQIVTKTGGRLYNIISDNSQQIGPGQAQHQLRRLQLRDVGAISDSAVVISR